MNAKSVLLAVGLWAGATFGSRPLLYSASLSAFEKALEQKTTLVIYDQKPVFEVLKLITQHTGVPLHMSPESGRLLPYGPETTMKVAIRGLVLRQALEDIFRPVGMTPIVKDEHVEISPMPALRRLGRPPRLEERKLLETLARTPWNPSTAKRLPMQFRVQRENAWEVLLATAEDAGAGTQAHVLELACNRLKWTWFPSGRMVVVVDEHQQLTRQLDRMISLEFVRQPVTHITEQLAERAGLSITIQPAALELLGPDARDHVSLIAHGVTVREALHQLAEATGMTVSVQSDGVVLEPGPALKSRHTDSASHAVMATISIPLSNGSHIEVPIRASDCPPALRAWLEEQKRKGLEALLQEAQIEP